MSVESDNDFMERLRKEQEERAAGPNQTNTPLRLEKDPLYKFRVTDAFGKKDNEYGDFMALVFDPENSPVCKGFKSEGENMFFVRRGVMRTLRQMVLRDCENNDAFPELISGVVVDQKSGERRSIPVKVPKIAEPIDIQFIIIEDEPKAGFDNGFKHVLGEPVDAFTKKWEANNAFIDRVKKEREDYLEEVRSTGSDDTKKLGHKEMGFDKPIGVHIVDMFASVNSENPFMVVKIDPEASPLWPGYDPEKDGVFGRMHLSTMTLKSFMSMPGIKELPPKDQGAAVQVGYDTDKDEPDLVRVPQIPEDGLKVRFFRIKRESKSSGMAYAQVLGEVVDSFE